MAVRLVETLDSPDWSGRIGGVWGNPQKDSVRACPELAEGAGGWEEEPFVSPVTYDQLSVAE